MNKQAIIEQLQAILNGDLIASGYTASTLAIELEEGKVYTRIVKRHIYPNGESNRSVYGFIRNADLTLWKAAGWKAPAKNKARGVVADLLDLNKVIPNWRYSIS